MRLKKSLQFAMIALAFTIAVGAQAKSKDIKSMLLHHDVTVGSSHLASGNYQVKWETHSPEATVSFMRAGKVVATVQGKVVDRGRTFESDEVVYDVAADGSRTIHEIRFEGSSQVIVFNE